MTHWHNKVFKAIKLNCFYCFGGRSKTPDLPPTPAPTPVPVPAAQPGEVAASAESKRNKINQLKMAGMQSNIRNVGGAGGVSGAGVDLANPMATKKTLGA